MSQACHEEGLAHAEPVLTAATHAAGGQPKGQHEFGAYNHWRLSNLVNVLHFWRARRIRRLRCDSFMRKQAAVEELCKDLTGGQETAIVAWGDASFQHYGPGNRAVPNKGITRVLRTKCRCMRSNKPTVITFARRALWRALLRGGEYPQ